MRPTLCINLISLGTLMLQRCKLSNKKQVNCHRKRSQCGHVLEDKKQCSGCGLRHARIGRERSARHCDQCSSGVGTTRESGFEGEPRALRPRFGHLNYADVERMATDPSIGIELTDRVGENGLTCAEGKQAKTAQPRKNSGGNTPIDVFDGVICSDLKGPITPIDRKRTDTW